MDVKFVSGRSITWDDSVYTTDDLVLTNEYDLGRAEGRMSSGIAPYLNGESFYAQTLAPRDIVLQYIIRADTAALRDAFLQTLKTAFNPMDGLGLLTLTMPGGEQYAIWCTPNGEPEAFAGGGRRPTHQYVNVALRAPYPFFMDPTVNTVTLLSFSGGLAFPWATPWTFGAGTTVLTVTNAGNVATPVIITFNGPITNPRIDNLTTGKYIKATMSLAAAESLEINTGQSEHTVLYTSGGTTTNGFQYLEDDSEFWWLEPGANILTFSSSTSVGAAASCTVEYYDRFLGI